VTLLWVLPHPEPGFFCKIMMAMVSVFACYMLKDMIKSIMKRINQFEEMCKLNIEYEWFTQDEKKLSALSYFKGRAQSSVISEE